MTRGGWSAAVAISSHHVSRSFFHSSRRNPGWFDGHVRTNTSHATVPTPVSSPDRLSLLWTHPATPPRPLPASSFFSPSFESINDKMATNGTPQGSADTTHTPSQRYLSTRGEDTGVCPSPNSCQWPHGPCWPSSMGLGTPLTRHHHAVLLRGGRPQGPRHRRRPLHPRRDP